MMTDDYKPKCKCPGLYMPDGVTVESMPCTNPATQEDGDCDFCRSSCYLVLAAEIKDPVNDPKHHSCKSELKMSLHDLTMRRVGWLDSSETPPEGDEGGWSPVSAVKWVSPYPKELS